MKVYVIMSNDYPDRVFANEADAEAFCAEKKSADENKNLLGRWRIYWRVYSFDVIETPPPTNQEK